VGNNNTNATSNVGRPKVHFTIEHVSGGITPTDSEGNPQQNTSLISRGKGKGVRVNLVIDPDFTNVEAWQSPNNPYAPTFYGQCTWFAWGRFYEIYGYSPGFLGNGNECVWELLEAHPDKFVFSKTPIPGAVGSSDFDHNHVFIVVDVDGDLLTIQDGNMNGVTDNWEVAITDWRKATFTMEEYSSYFGDLVFANPIYLPEED